MAAKKQVNTAPVAWGGEAETVDDLPEVGSRPSGQNAAPLGETAKGEPWFWVASPESWQVLFGRVVPSLRKITLHRGGGRNNVDSVKGPDGRRRADPTMALALAARRGETVLDFRDPRTYVTMPDGSRAPYLTKVRATGGYISRFEQVFGGTAATTTDTDAFTAWLAELITNGVIPQPPIWQMIALKIKIEGQIVSYTDRGGQKAAYGSRVAQLKKDLAAVTEAIAANRQRTLQGATSADTDDELPDVPSGAVKKAIDATSRQPTDAV